MASGSVPIIYTVHQTHPRNSELPQTELNERFQKVEISDNGWCFYNSITYGLGLVGDSNSRYETDYYSYILGHIIGNKLITILRNDNYDLIDLDTIQTNYEALKNEQLENLKRLLANNQATKATIASLGQPLTKINNDIRKKDTEITRLENTETNKDFIIDEVKKSFNPKDHDTLESGPVE